MNNRTASTPSAKWSCLAVLSALFLVGCVSYNAPRAPAPTAAASPPTASSNQKAPPGAGGKFSTGVVCSLPRQAFPGTKFANLGGGSWGRWDASGGELGYGCNGGSDSIKLIDDGSVDITAEYGAIGGPESVHYVSAEYMAFQFGGQTPDERSLRSQYADFCDKLSERFYGQKLPAKFRKRLLDESAYSQSGTANEYAEKVGMGYVNLSSNKNADKMFLLDVHFFSSEAEYKMYKDE